MYAIHVQNIVLISKAKRVFIPVFWATGWHWVLVELDKGDKVARLYDSTAALRGVTKQAATNLARWLCRATNQDDSTWKVEVVKAPVQGDSVSCGVFMLMCMKYRSSNVRLKHNAGMALGNRFQLLAEILRKIYGLLTYCTIGRLSAHGHPC